MIKALAQPLVLKTPSPIPVRSYHFLSLEKTLDQRHDGTLCSYLLFIIVSTHKEFTKQPCIYPHYPLVVIPNKRYFLLTISCLFSRHLISGVTGHLASSVTIFCVRKGARLSFSAAHASSACNCYPDMQGTFCPAVATSLKEE